MKWTLGVEIELLAPPGRSRLDLARAIAAAAGGDVRACYHPQSEPSRVSGTPVFQNLTLGYEARSPAGDLVARCLDDLTLQANLDRGRAPVDGWYRIASDDTRFLNLIEQQTDPAAPMAEILEPLARLYGTETERNEDGLVRVSDKAGATIAILAPLPGERERPCELVTPPITDNHLERLAEVLNSAKSLGFTAPVEGATHLHFDGAALCSAPVIAVVVELFSQFAKPLKSLFQTNRHCIRLGPWPKRLRMLVRQPAFQALAWDDAREQMAATGVAKYCDFNLLNLVEATLDKHTFEIRILPVLTEPEEIVDAAAFFEAMLVWAIEAAAEGRPVPDQLPKLIADLTLPEGKRRYWIGAL